MNLKQLEYFVSVAENLNFTKAAGKCYISQTAMTLQIRALEENIGVPLFIRDKHHVELTSAGQVYLEEVREILRRSSEAVRLARSAAEGSSGALCVGFIRGYEQSGFPEFIRRFHESCPNISLSFLRDNMSALYTALEDGSCDVAFNMSPYVQSAPQLRHRFLKSCPIIAVLYPGHPLAERKTLRYRDLKGEDFIIMQPEGRADEEAEEVVICFNRGGFVPRIVHREREVQTLLLMVSAALGITILPEYAVPRFGISASLAPVPLVREDGSAETLNFEVSWKRENTNPALEKLLALVKPKEGEEEEMRYAK